jgi:MFS family permease
MVVLSVFGLASSLVLLDAPRDPAAEKARRFVATLADRRLLSIWLVGTVFATASAAIFVFMKTYLLETKAGTVGMFFAAYALTAVALRLGLGWVPDRIGPVRVFFPAVVVFASGLLLLAFARSPLALVASGVLTGAGHGYAFPILAGLVVARAPSSERGAALSIFTAIFDVGMLLGGPLFGWVIAASSHTAAYIVAALGSLAGLFAFRALERRV